MSTRTDPIASDAKASDFFCEVEDHTPGDDPTGDIFIPDGDRQCVICKACLKEMFENVMRKEKQ